jgi:proteasome accessory factor BC
MNGREGWYVAAFDPSRGALRHFRLDRIKSAQLRDETFERREDLEPLADIGGWPRTGTVGGSNLARVWVDEKQARWATEGRSATLLADGSAIVDWPYKGVEFLVREVLKEAGDAVVLEPPEARDAVLHAAEALLAPAR